MNAIWDLCSVRLSVFRKACLVRDGSIAHTDHTLYTMWDTHTSIVLYCACTLTVTGSVKRSLLHNARCVIVAHRFGRLQANLHASAKEEFDILNYHYLINNDPPPRFIGWVVRRGRVIDRPVNCQTDEILQFWHRRKSTSRWLTAPSYQPLPPPMSTLASTKNGHATHVYISRLLSSPELFDWYLKLVNLQIEMRGVELINLHPGGVTNLFLES